ncbi:hypothetical protein [Streptomyces sp. SID8499]|uniref:hypothetical protein n=1 Tax=Streptomyces sp. SID8499 TaxID=2706106 RepID=UPI0013C587EB|nr:hypothetical protein [Streptomyces sp. SID8499]NED35583.1 hypothetical protein [Streptomyces sp. SID8499]
MNARKAKQRRRELRERNERLLAQIRAAEAVFHEAHGGAWESWTKGPAMLFVPTLCEDYPPDVKEAVIVRRQAAFTGECGCGLEVRITPAGQYDLRHGAGCPGEWGMFKALARAAGWNIELTGGIDTDG